MSSNAVPSDAFLSLLYTCSKNIELKSIDINNTFVAKEVVSREIHGHLEIIRLPFNVSTGKGV